MKRLLASETERYFNNYLPYNIRIFVCFSNYTRRPRMLKSKEHMLEAMFIAALIKGKMLLETIGITLNSAKSHIIRYNPSSSDIMARYLGGRSVDIDKLSEEQQQLLVWFLNTVQKKAIHYAEPDSYMKEMRHICEATDLIMMLIKGHLYSGRTFDWYQSKWGKWARKKTIKISSIQLTLNDAAEWANKCNTKKAAVGVELSGRE